MCHTQNMITRDIRRTPCAQLYVAKYKLVCMFIRFIYTGIALIGAFGKPISHWKHLSKSVALVDVPVLIHCRRSGNLTLRDRTGFLLVLVHVPLRVPVGMPTTVHQSIR